MENKNVICKICYKGFTNGKAMGGHMRSHMAKLPLPAKPNPQASKQRITCEEDTDYDRSLVRSKRCRLITPPESSSSEHISSLVSEEVTSVEEVAAWNLVMLSRDSWSRKRHHKILMINGSYSESTEEEEDVFVQPNRAAIYKCETCNKVFKSYQALGGHRASHKKMKRIISFKEEVEEYSESSSEREGGGGDYKCTLCNKVFESAQALGGHKKVHFDLNNQPADDDDEDQRYYIN